MQSEPSRHMGFEALYLGHAGVLIKNGDLYIAIDPFLSGSFKWHRKINRYQGNSPWIGENGLNRFCTIYASKLNAVLITHDHGDHYDLTTIERILRVNPKIKIYAPKPIIKMIKRKLRKMLQKETELKIIQSGNTLSVIRTNKEVMITPLINARSKLMEFPDRVGFLIENLNQEDSKGIFITGDSHGIGEWDEYKGRIDHLITWGVKKIVEEFPVLIQTYKIQHVWWIHWEDFTPGNFHCSQDIHEVMERFKTLDVIQGLLEYENWTTMD